MRQYCVKSQKPVTQLRFRPNSSELTGLLSHGKKLVAWDLVSGNVQQLKHFRGDTITSFDYSPDGTRFAVGDVGSIATIYEVPGFRRLDQLILVSGQTYVQVREWPISKVAFASSLEPRNQWVVAISSEIQLRNIKTCEVIAAFDLGHYESVVFTPKGDSIVVVNRATSEIVSYTIKPVRVRFTIKSHGDLRSQEVRLAISPDGETIAVTEGAGVRMLNGIGVTRGRITTDQSPHDFVFLPGGQLAVADGGPTVKIFDTRTHRKVQEFDWGIGTVYSLTVHPDGTMAAAGGENGQVVVWDLEG